MLSDTADDGDPLKLCSNDPVTVCSLSLMLVIGLTINSQQIAALTPMGAPLWEYLLRHI